MYIFKITFEQLKNRYTVFFTASFTGREKYLKDYKKVLAALTNNKSIEKVITPETVPFISDGRNYLEVLNLNRKYPLKEFLSWPLNNKKRLKIHYEAIRKSILMADMCVFEATYPSFRIGHEATLAVQFRKPTLVLSQKENMDDKLFNPYFHGVQYGASNLQNVIDKFVRMAAYKVLSNRFNMLLSDEEKDFLELQANREGLSKAEYIRNLIVGEMKGSVKDI